VNLRRVLAVELPLAAIGYSLLTALITWPVVSDIGSTVLGPADSDSAGGIWWLDAIQAHGYRLTGTTTFDQVASPFGLHTANALNIQTFIPYFPAFLATKVVGEVAAFNLTMLIGFVLSGCAMYFLARRIGAAPMVAAWSGLVYIMFPWHVERAVAGHASLVHIWVFPLLALALLQVHERCTNLRLTVVGAAILACWLTSAYYGVMALALVPVAALAVALVTVPRRRALAIAAVLSTIAVGISGAVFVASLAGGKDGGYGDVRQVSDLDRYGLRPIELGVPAPASVVMKRLVPGYLEGRRHGSNIQEVSNYLGWTTILLAALWLAIALRGWRRLDRTARALTVGAGAAGLAALALALPSPVTIFGVTWNWMPARVLWEIVPAFRVPTRWIVPLLFCVLVLGTLGLQAIVRRLALARPDWRAVQIVVVGLIAIASFFELRISHPGVHYSATNVPPEYGLLAEAPPGAVAEYPMVSAENSTDSEYLLWQRKHGRALINGAALGTESEDVRRTLVDPTAPGNAARLAALGATAAITRPNTFSRALEQELPDVPPRLGAGYERIGTLASGVSVWAVVAAPAPAIAFLASPEFSIPKSTRGRIVQELVGPTGTIGVRASTHFSGTMHLWARALNAASRHVMIGGTAVDVTEAGLDLVIPIDISASRSTVQVRVSGVRVGEAGLSLTAPNINRQ
jgi:hypothetical protein